MTGTAHYPGIDAPHSMLRGGSVYYYARDNQGSVLALFNASMQVTHSYQYSPYGEIESASGSVPQPFRFTGREYDSETGLYYYRARYYDPELGRFISEDPIGLEGGINLYAYVGNNPVNNRDPSGLYQQAADGDTIPIPLEGLVVTGKRQGGDVTVITFQSFPNARGGDNSDTCMVPESGGARFGQGGSAGARGAGAGGGQVTAQKNGICGSGRSWNDVARAGWSDAKVYGLSGVGVGGVIGGTVGGTAGGAAGATAGNLIGLLTGAPTLGIGYVASVYTGTMAGTTAGVFVGAWTGAKVGLVIGGFGGFSAGVYSSLVKACVTGY